MSDRGRRKPREMSLIESSPPYEPSHPATASMSTEMQQRAPAIVRIVHAVSQAKYLRFSLMIRKMYEFFNDKNGMNKFGFSLSLVKLV